MTVVINEQIKGLGYIPDLPDIRDFSLNNAHNRKETPLTKVMQTVFKEVTEKKDEPDFISLFDYASPVKDQKSLGSCTAFATIAMMELLVRRTKKKNIKLSPLFLYKMTRDLHGWTGDTGAYMRSAMKAASKYGIPEENDYPYIIQKYEEMPQAKHFAAASNYNALTFFRHDDYEHGPSFVIKSIKSWIRKGFPAIIGFTCYESMFNPDVKYGHIPFPTANEQIEGGHAVTIIGYDNEKTIGNPFDRNVITKGAFLIQNSWGSSWGDKGFGWLPYSYIEAGQANDIWTATKTDFLESIDL